MKKILTLISIFTLSTLSAQTLVAPFQDVEQPRGVVIPYGRAVDATKADPSASNYVAKLSAACRKDLLVTISEKKS